MWTCPLVFCDFEKFAQKCFRFAAANMPYTLPFMLKLSSACMLLHVQNHGLHLSPPRFKPCDEMLLGFCFSHPTHPVCSSLRLACNTAAFFLLLPILFRAWHS